MLVVTRGSYFMLFSGESGAWGAHPCCERSNREDKEETVLLLRQAPEREREDRDWGPLGSKHSTLE
jgi:hypothetical protein